MCVCCVCMYVYLEKSDCALSLIWPLCTVKRWLSLICIAGKNGSFKHAEPCETYAYVCMYTWVCMLSLICIAGKNLGFQARFRLALRDLCAYVCWVSSAPVGKNKPFKDNKPCKACACMYVYMYVWMHANTWIYVGCMYCSMYVHMWKESGKIPVHQSR